MVFMINIDYLILLAGTEFTEYSEDVGFEDLWRDKIGQ